PRTATATAYRRRPRRPTPSASPVVIRPRCTRRSLRWATRSGAVGALESVLTVLTLRDGVIPPTLNYETPDPEIDLDVVAGEPRYGDYRYAVNNSFGFGGHNVALAFGRY
ncbi:beta-ketoacyl-ACP synthase 1, partial [Mycobacterium tuberculosis T92]